MKWERFQAWRDDPCRVYRWNTWEARFWTLFGMAGVAFRPLRESIPVLFFLSAYANSKAARAEAQAAHNEMDDHEQAHQQEERP